jgi:hypothetical protein
VIEKDNDFETGLDALSVTVTVNMKFPGLVAVPLKDPSFPSVRPGGRAPAVMLHVSG